MPDTPAALLQVRGLSKRFPGVKALNKVDLELGRGEVLAVIGENGAGKSTLMKILAGVQPADEGQVLLDGEPAAIGDVRQALDSGIALIHQELNLAGNLSVGANLFLGAEPRRFGLIDNRRIRRESKEVLKRVGLSASPQLQVDRLPIGQQQLVEIAKALRSKARILIMDEPTSSLSLREVGRLFEVIKDLRQRGVSVIYISHRLGEVKELADRVLVLRDGENAGSLSREEIDHDRMVRLMVGRDVSQFYVRVPHTPGDEVLKVEGLRTEAHPQYELDFSLRAGEIVGVAGLVGAGRTEMLASLFGIDRRLGGRVTVGGKPLAGNDPRAAIRAGMVLAPEDRKQQGLVLEMTVRENLSLPALRQRAKAGMVDRRYERQLAGEMIEKLGIRTPSAEQIVQFLSGGNQQKVVLGKWLAMQPRVLLLDEPTRGVDVGAKQQIYLAMEKLAADGMAILFVSSELEEIIGMADRVLVMHEGRFTGELPRDELTEESIMHLATGGSRAA